MADQGLFGASPQDIQDLRAQQYEQAANNYAAQTPLERGSSLMFQAGAGLVAPIAGMFGGRDRQVVAAEQMQAIQSKIDHNTPEGLMQGAKVFQDAGKPDMARRYVLAAQSMAAQTAQMAQHNADARYKNAQADKAMRTDDTPNMPPAAQMVRYYNSLPDKTTEEAQQLKSLIEATIQKTTKQSPTGSSKVSLSQYELSPEQQRALDAAMTSGKLDPSRVNSRTAKILANQFLFNPDLDMVSGTSVAALRKNQTMVQKSNLINSMPEILRKVVDAGTKVDFSKYRPLGSVEAIIKAGTNNPDFVEYMNLRNDALQTIAGVMRSVGMSDKSIELESEAASKLMDPAALAAWYRGQMKSLQPRIDSFNKSMNMPETPKTEEWVRVNGKLVKK